MKDMKLSANNSEVIATLTKKERGNWRGLLQGAVKKETVKIDFSRAVDSDDETDSEDEREVSPPRPPRGDDVSLICKFLLESKHSSFL